jgi:hypothetical protein
MNNFASFTLGQISAPVNILKEFLEIFNRRHKCKAAILSWLDGKHFYGQEWTRITFEELGKILGYCRETISKHIRELAKDKLIDELPANRFPKDTANMYRLNPNWLPPIEFDKSEWGILSKLLGFWKHLDMLPKILFSWKVAPLGETPRPHFPLCRCEKIDVDRPINEPVRANNPPTLETNLNFFKNNNTAVAEKEEVRDERGEPDREQSQVTETNEPIPTLSHYVEIQERFSLDDEIDPTEGDFSAPAEPVILNSEKTSDQNQNKPTKQQIKETCAELKRLRINPDPCLGVIKKYWGNVAGAIARVKEAVAEGWCDNPTGLFINSCKSGAKGKNAMPSEVNNWLDWAFKKRIVLAFQGGFVYPVNGEERVPLEEMMQRYPMEET